MIILIFTSQKIHYSFEVICCSSQSQPKHTILTHWLNWKTRLSQCQTSLLFMIFCFTLKPWPNRKQHSQLNFFPKSDNIILQICQNIGNEYLQTARKMWLTAPFMAGLSFHVLSINDKLYWVALATYLTPFFALLQSSLYKFYIHLRFFR